MSARGSGTIINIGSVSDRKASPVAYSAIKYAVRSISESLPQAEGLNGVRVTNAARGYVRRNLHKRYQFQEIQPELGNPDFLSAEEVVEGILFCWKLPPWTGDILVTPTRSTF